LNILHWRTVLICAPLFTVESNREERVVNYLRFADLKARGVVRNWTTLSRLVREQKFPPGTRVGAQSRAWEEAEVEAWLASRRIAVPVHAAPAAALVQEAELPPGDVSGSARAKRKQPSARPKPPAKPRGRPRSFALSNALENNPRR
jgi:hypothetical protein